MIYKSRAMQEWEAKNGEPIDEYLRRVYVDEDKTVDDIARDLDVTKSTASVWLHKCGIPVRPQGRRGREGALEDDVLDPGDGSVEYLTLGQTGARLGVSRTTVQEYIRVYGDFPVVKLSPRKWLVPSWLLDEWMEKRVGQEPPALSTTRRFGQGG